MWIAFECKVPRLERVRVDFAGPDAQRMINRGDKDFAVADLPSLGRAAMASMTGSAWGSSTAISDSDLRQQIHRVFGAAIDLGVALLAAVAFGFDNSHALQADAPERFAHVVELEWLDDGDDQLHRPRSGWAATKTDGVKRDFLTRSADFSMRVPML